MKVDVPSSPAWFFGGKNWNDQLDVAVPLQVTLENEGVRQNPLLNM